MCGIVGIVNARGRLDRADLAILNETLHARGPDGAGIWWERDGGLAMRRLAIIDLAGGDQPLFSEDGRVVVVANAEIYNYRELRAQLVSAGHVFASHVDTEVLVHGYEQWGIDGLLDRVDGMFAFAVWDCERRRVFVARDRFGEKPFYLACEDGTVVFSSYLLTAVAALGATPPVDEQSLQLYWALHYVPGDRTIFEGVRRLRPGEAYELDADTGEIRRRWRYWALREGEERDQSASALRSLVSDAVASRLVADVPVGVFLSGGLDSSLLAALAAAQVPGIHTFSVGFASAQHDESEHAARVAAAVGATHHPYAFGLSEFRDLIPQVVEAMDEPVGDQAMLPVYALAREASQVVKVVLSGEGADELFGGYSYYRPFADQARPSRWRRWRSGAAEPPPSSVFLDSTRTASGFPLVTPTAVREALSPGSLDAPGAWSDELTAALGEVRDPVRRATLSDVETWLSEDLLMKADKMTMAHSLESRAPYLARSLAEAAFQLPPAAKADHREVKVRLRDAAASLVPAEIRSRPKQGFVLPMDSWLRDDLHDEFVDAIRACREPLIDTAAMERAVRRDRNGDGDELGGRVLYPMLVIVRWLEHAQRTLADTRSRLRQPAAASNVTHGNGS